MKALLGLLAVHESGVELGLEELGLGVKLKLKLGTGLELVVGRSYGLKREVLALPTWQQIAEQQPHSLRPSTRTSCLPKTTKGAARSA